MIYVQYNGQEIKDINFCPSATTQKMKLSVDLWSIGKYVLWNGLKEFAKDQSDYDKFGVIFHFCFPSFGEVKKIGSFLFKIKFFFTSFLSMSIWFYNLGKVYVNQTFQMKIVQDKW